MAVPTTHAEFRKIAGTLRNVNSPENIHTIKHDYLLFIQNGTKTCLPSF